MAHRAILEALWVIFPLLIRRLLLSLARVKVVRLERVDKALAADASLERAWKSSINVIVLAMRPHLPSVDPGEGSTILSVRLRPIDIHCVEVAED